VSDDTDTHPTDTGVTARLREAGRPPRDAITRRMHQSVTEGLFGGGAEPVRIDRYVVLERVASGAIGTVVAAYDPQLDRRVAIKLLRTRGDDAWRKRMMREAKALARLSHPNVVAVHDAGEHDGEVFVAMELVEGVDVARWLAAEPRPWPAVLDVFVQAGRGLAAAHAAGIVHRDVKPANILVGRDGRVRVADFGLSRTRSDTSADPAATSGEHDTQDLDAVTVAGVRVGTPAYMAPEQHRGEPATDRSDQFQFCVGLYEGLFGRRPFSGIDDASLRAAKERGPSAPPDDHRVPTPTVAAILRGLHPDPGARHPDMDALLRAIAIDPASGRRRWLVAGVSGLAIAAAVGIASRGPAPCVGSDARLAGTWDADRRAEIQAAFAGSGAPYHAHAWDRVAAELDDHASQIAATQREACEATRVRGEHSEAVLDHRSRCLGLRVRELAALVDELARPDAELVTRATAAAGGLSEPETCLDAAIDLDEAVPSPEAQMDLERLAEANGRRVAGRYASALELAHAVSEAAATRGDDAVRAEALVLEADARLELGARAEAEATLREAVVLARSSARPRTEARGWIALVRLAEPKDGEDMAGFWSRLARASLDAAGGDRKLEADLERNTGTALATAGDYAGAVTHFERARDLFEAEHGAEGLSVANTDDSIGSTLHLLGRHDESLAHHERAAAILERRLGPDHPYVGTAIANVASELGCRGDLDRALERYEHALGVVEAALGPDATKVAALSSNYAVVLRKLDRLDEARARYDRAADILVRRYGADHPDALRVLANVADIQSAQGDLRGAEATYRRVLTGLGRRLGSAHADVAIAHSNLAWVLERLDQNEEAIEHLTTAVAALEATLSEQHAATIGALERLGDLHAAHGDPGLAREAYARALAQREASGASDEELAALRAAVAALPAPR
jgi:tetratricopeptide (TPR) repeat protein